MRSGSELNLFLLSGLTHLVNFYLGENRMIRTYAGKAVLSSKEEAAMQSLVSEGLRKSGSRQVWYHADRGDA